MPGMCGWYPVTLHQVFCPAFAALDARRRLRRAKDAQATFLEDIHDASTQRVIWPNDGEVNRVVGSPIGALDKIHDAQRNILRKSGGPSVARRAIERAQMRRAGNCPGQGMLAGARTNNKHAHGSFLSSSTVI